MAATAADVLNFFLDRSAFDHWWDSLDPDVQADIRTELQEVLDTPTVGG